MKKFKFTMYLVFVISFVSSVALSVCPESHAKYITKDSKDYKTSLMQLTYTDTYDRASNITLNNTYSTYRLAVWNVRINKNKVMYGDSEKYDRADSYKISVPSTTGNTNPNSCRILTSYPVTTSGTLGTVTEQEIPITYTSNSIDDVNKDDTISFKIACDVIDDENVDDSTEWIKLNFSVTEQITGYDTVEDEFLYLDASTERSISDYRRTEPLPEKEEDGTLTYRAQAIEAINEKYSTESAVVKNYLEEYFNTVFPEGTSNADFAANSNSLKGFVYDNETYNFDDNFLGYALTYHERKSSLNEDITDYNWFFSGTDASKKFEAFKYYMNTYGSSELKKAKNQRYVIDLIESYDNTYEELYMGDGYLYSIDVDIPTNDNYSADTTQEMVFDDRIIDMGRNRNILPLRKLTNGRINDDSMYDAFYYTVGNQLEYATYKKNINSSDNVFNILTKNSMGNSLTSFSSIIDLPTSDGTAISSASKAVLNIFSSAELESDNLTYTYFNLCEIADGEEMMLSYLNEDNITKQVVIDKINELEGNSELAGNLLTVDSFNGTPATSSETITDGNGDATVVTHNVYTVNGINYDIRTYDTIPGVTFISYTQNYS